MRNKSVGVGVANINSIAKDVIKSIMVMMMSEKRFTFVCDDENCRFKDNGKTIDCVEVVNKLNEQQATIEMYQRRVDKREEQISIIKKHCLKFLTNEQFETIRKELENE